MGDSQVVLGDGFLNWTLTCKGLNVLHTGLSDFVDSEIAKLHVAVRGTNTCNECTTKTITGRYKAKCDNDVCDKIRQEIEKHHRYFPPCWINTDATKWGTNHWEIAKCFMSKGYAKKQSAVDTDCTGLLSVCINYRNMPLAIPIKPPNENGSESTDIFHKNRDARNAIVHSPFSLTQQERQAYIKDMITLLKIYKQPIDHVTKAAIDELEQLHNVDISKKLSIKSTDRETKPHTGPAYSHAVTPRRCYGDALMPEVNDREYLEYDDRVTSTASTVQDDGMTAEISTVGLVMSAEEELDILLTKLESLEYSQCDIEDTVNQHEEQGHGADEINEQLLNISQSLTVLRARLRKFPGMFRRDVTDMQDSCMSLEKKNEELRQQLFIPDRC